ncbi:hypothetical protein C9413_22235 [Rhizobium sp. SEMIA 4085]|nr:hypothetical protein [Rhizobium gallicum]NNH32090.1 hypothetical protein [Rhizobium sp. SEMIA 4085]
MLLHLSAEGQAIKDRTAPVSMCISDLVGIGAENSARDQQSKLSDALS